MKRLIHFIYLFSILSFAQPSSGGMYFDGVNDNFTVPTTTNINSTTTNNRSYETYFKVTSTTSRQIIMKEGGGTRAVIIYVENGYLVLGAYNRADYTPSWKGTFYRKAITANTWYHLALVFDNAQAGNATTNPMNATSNTALKFYLDGVLEADNSGYQLGGHNSIRLGYKNETLRFPNCGTWTATSGSAEYCFGTANGDNGGNEYYLQGNIWGFRVWNDVRTATEINDNMDTIITTVGIDDLVAALDGDTFTYLNSSHVPIDVSNSNPPNTITWKSNAGSTNWNAASNWIGGSVPNVSKLEPVLIPTSTNYPVITGHVIAGDLEVQTGAEIIINDGGTLDVNYDLLNNGTITVKNNGSIINRESKPVSGSGTFIVKRDTPDYLPYFYSIWSTPVTEADSQMNTIFTNWVDIYDYDTSQNPATYVKLGGGANMEVGKGYFIRSINDSGVITRTFDGTINNGDIDEPIYHNSPTDNNNLIGNPYPSAIDWLAFHADNSDILNGTMYYWSQSYAGPNNLASDYVSFNYMGSNVPGTTGDIATGQGIFVESLQAGTVTFKNTHRVVGNNNQFFRSSENPDNGKSWLRLSGTMGYSPILIGFVPGATDGYENAYDGNFINEGAALEFYSFIDSNKYSIQGRSELQAHQNIQVPIGFEVTSAGDYTISIELDYIDSSSFEILLEDTLLNSITDLRTSDYTFNVASPTEDNSRFILHYNYNETLNSEEFVGEPNSIKSFFFNDELITNRSEGLSLLSLQLYDIAGKEILTVNYEDRIYINNLSSGIYIVKYLSENKKIVSRKIIKR